MKAVKCSALGHHTFPRAASIKTYITARSCGAPQSGDGAEGRATWPLQQLSDSAQIFCTFGFRLKQTRKARVLRK